MAWASEGDRILHQLAIGKCASILEQSVGSLWDSRLGAKMAEYDDTVSLEALIVARKIVFELDHPLQTAQKGVTAEDEVTDRDDQLDIPALINLLHVAELRRQWTCDQANMFLEAAEMTHGERETLRSILEVIESQEARKRLVLVVLGLQRWMIVTLITDRAWPEALRAIEIYFSSEKDKPLHFQTFIRQESETVRLLEKAYRTTVEKLSDGTAPMTGSPLQVDLKTMLRMAEAWLSTVLEYMQRFATFYDQYDASPSPPPQLPLPPKFRDVVHSPIANSYRTPQMQVSPNTHPTPIPPLESNQRQSPSPRKKIKTSHTASNLRQNSPSASRERSLEIPTARAADIVAISLEETMSESQSISSVTAALEVTTSYTTAPKDTTWYSTIPSSSLLPLEGGEDELDKHMREAANGSRAKELRDAKKKRASESWKESRRSSDGQGNNRDPQNSDITAQKSAATLLRQNAPRRSAASSPRSSVPEERKIVSTLNRSRSLTGSAKDAQRSKKQLALVAQVESERSVVESITFQDNRGGFDAVATQPPLKSAMSETMMKLLRKAADANAAKLRNKGSNSVVSQETPQSTGAKSHPQLDEHLHSLYSTPAVDISRVPPISKDHQSVLPNINGIRSDGELDAAHQYITVQLENLEKDKKTTISAALENGSLSSGEKGVAAPVVDASSKSESLPHSSSSLAANLLSDSFEKEILAIPFGSEPRDSRPGLAVGGGNIAEVSLSQSYSQNTSSHDTQNTIATGTSLEYVSSQEADRLIQSARNGAALLSGGSGFNPTVLSTQLNGTYENEYLPPLVRRKSLENLVELQKFVYSGFEVPKKTSSPARINGASQRMSFGLE